MPRGRAVEVVGTDGVVLQSWPSAMVAMRETGVPNYEIGKVCNAGGGETRGLYFRYKDRDSSTDTDKSSTFVQKFVRPRPDARDRMSQCYLDTTDGKEHEKKARRGKQPKPVLWLCAETGKALQEYNNVDDVVPTLRNWLHRSDDERGSYADSTLQSYVRDCCNGRRTDVFGIKFTYKENCKKKKQPKPVLWLCAETGKALQEYNNVDDVVPTLRNWLHRSDNERGSYEDGTLKNYVRDCCNGRRTDVFGIKFTYKENYKKKNSDDDDDDDDEEGVKFTYEENYNFDDDDDDDDDVEEEEEEEVHAEEEEFRPLDSRKKRLQNRSHGTVNRRKICSSLHRQSLRAENHELNDADYAIPQSFLNEQKQLHQDISNDIASLKNDTNNEIRKLHIAFDEQKQLQENILNEFASLKKLVKQQCQNQDSRRDEGLDSSNYTRKDRSTTSSSSHLLQSYQKDSVAQDSEGAKKRRASCNENSMSQCAASYQRDSVAQDAEGAKKRRASCNENSMSQCTTSYNRTTMPQVPLRGTTPCLSVDSSGSSSANESVEYHSQKERPQPSETMAKIECLKEAHQLLKEGIIDHATHEIINNGLKSQLVSDYQ